jgi:hypothetical protein
MVLPKNSLYNILSELDYIDKEQLLYIKSTLLNYKSYYPDNLCIDLANKRYLWQSKLFFEPIAIDERILDIVLN